MIRKILDSFWALLPDKCQVYGCKRQGILGNENRIPIGNGYIIICDYCHAQSNL